MKPILTLTLCLSTLVLPRSALASVNFDCAANYAAGWTNGDNGGGGFGPWTIQANAGEGWAGYGIWASSNADLSMGNAFGFIASGAGACVYLDRPFSQVLSTGDVFTVDLGMNYSAGLGGNKGLILRTSDNRDIVTVNQGDSDAITINGTIALTNYGNNAMHWTFTQSSPTQIVVYATGRSGAEAYTTTVKTTQTSYLASLRFYAASVTNDASADLRAVYFDNLVLSQGAGTNTFTYSVLDSRTTITGIASNAAGAVVIPATLGGYPVSAIGRAAFLDCTNLTSITFASSTNVTSIGPAAFQGCTGLLLAVLPPSLTAIPPSLFCGCSSLVSVTIPGGVTNIGDAAFDGCRSLNALALPAGLKSVGESAFLNCRSLHSVHLPDTLANVAGQLCYECQALTAIGFPSGLTNLGYSALYNCVGLGSLTLPSTVTTIGPGALLGCSGLSSLTIHGALSNVGNQAFSGCDLLREVFFYGGVGSLGIEVFARCPALAGVYFLGNPPSLGGDSGADLFASSGAVTVYYLDASTSWGATFCGADVELWQPRILYPTAVSSGFQFAVTWAIGRTIRIQACSDLANPSWTDVSTNLVTSGVCSFTDPNAAAYPQRLYRILAGN